MRRLALALAAVSWVAVGTPAEAVPYAVAGVQNTYVPATWTIAQGDTLLYVNGENAPHDVTASDSGANGQPLFRSATVYGVGETADVRGVSALEPGGYAFYCSVHPDMRGSIQVT